MVKLEVNLDLSTRRLLLLSSAGVGACLAAFYAYRILSGNRSKFSAAAVVKRLKRMHPGQLFMKNEQFVINIIDKLKTSGTSQLHVIADFDATLTKTEEGGSPCQSTHACIEQSSYMPALLRDAAMQLRHQYAHYEDEPTLTIAEKTPFIIEWYTKSHELMISCGLTRDLLHKIVSNSRVVLRDGTAAFLRNLSNFRVPLLLFSAGIGDVIELVLIQNACDYPNIKIISNFLQFNGHGNMVGFQGDLIHVYNKDESVIHHSKYFEQLQWRKCALLLGDSLGDIRMSSGADHVETILKIGFLNNEVAANLDKYMDAYDIVICNDQSLSVVNTIFDAIE